MVNHICVKCKKEFNKKSTYLNHINKKFTCEPNKVVILDTPNIPHDTPKILPKIIENEEIFNNFNKIESFNNNSCLYCGLVMTRKDHLKRHMELRCKVKKLQDTEKENIFKILLAKDEELKTQKEFINKLD